MEDEKICPVCEGEGYIEVQIDVDMTKREPCPECNNESPWNPY